MDRIKLEMKENTSNLIRTNGILINSSSNQICSSSYREDNEEIKKKHEMFLQAFESRQMFFLILIIGFNFYLLFFVEPTQIYRYLRTRHSLTVRIFLKFYLLLIISLFLFDL